MAGTECFGAKSAKLNNDETFFMAGTECFGATAQPRNNIPEFCLSTPSRITQSHTFAALIRLSTTTHNLLAFNTSEISSAFIQFTEKSSSNHDFFLI